VAAGAAESQSVGVAADSEDQGAVGPGGEHPGGAVTDSSATRVLVAGGAGGVGEGIVAAWLRAGATVAVPSRDEHRLAALAASVAGLPGTLVTRVVPAADPDGLARWLDELGPMDQAVASIGGGGWRLAPLLRIQEPELRRIVEDGVVGHWAVARAVLRRVVPAGEYVMVNGGAALETIPGAEPMSFVARTQLVLAELLAGELDTAGPRVLSLVLNSPIITRTRPTGKAAWLTAQDVGQACVAVHRRPDLPPRLVLTTRADVAAIGAP
jgi:NAD(P)-dependent dehydrogenase (short-subunit alcohol dehydrogenase family)